MFNKINFLLTFSLIFYLSLLPGSILNNQKEEYELKVGESLHGEIVLKLDKVNEGVVYGEFQGNRFSLKEGESKKIRNEYENMAFIHKGKLTVVKVNKDSSVILLETREVYIYSIIVRLILSLIAAQCVIMVSRFAIKKNNK